MAQTSEERHSSGLLIFGESDYIAQVKKALDLAQGSQEGYETITKYVGRIEQVNPPSGMRAYENPPTFGMSRTVAFTYGDNELSVIWCVGSIAHDAFHSKLYHEYAANHWWVPDKVWTGQEAELECIKHQKAVIIDIGKSSNIDHAIIKNFTDYLDKLDGLHYTQPINYMLPLCTLDTMTCNLSSTQSAHSKLIPPV